MTYLAVDFGLKKIGLAISDGVLPTPLPLLVYKDQHEVLSTLVQIIDNNEVKKIVFGLPSPDKIGARKFAEKLQNLTNLETVFWDETLTSQLSKSQLKGKKALAKEDSVAAAKILEEYLENI